MKNIIVLGSSNTDFTFAKYNGHQFDQPITTPIDVFTWPHWLPEFRKDVRVYNYARSAYGLSYSLHILDTFIWMHENNMSHHAFPKPDLAILEIPNLLRDFMYFGPEDDSQDFFDIWHEYDGNKFTVRPRTPTTFIQRISRYENFFETDASNYFKKTMPDTFNDTLIQGSVMSLETRSRQQLVSTMRLKYYEQEFKQRFNCQLLWFYWFNIKRAYKVPNNFCDMPVVEHWHNYDQTLLHDGSHLNSVGSKKFFQEYFLNTNTLNLIDNL